MRILSEIDNYLELRNLEENEKKIRSSHHPSEVAQCSRAIYYKWINAPISNPDTAESIWRMEMGKAVELLAIQYLREMGYKVKEQEEITIRAEALKYPIHGYLDIVIETEDGDVGAEVKTTWGMGTKDVQNNGPKSDHIQQVMFYMIYKGMTDFNMMYIARDTLWRSEFIIRKSEDELYDFLSRSVDKFSKIEEAVDTRTLPPRDFHAIVADGEIKKNIQRKGVKYSSDWQCMYCQRRDLCYEDERNSYDLFIPGVNI